MSSVTSVSNEAIITKEVEPKIHEERRNNRAFVKALVDKLNDKYKNILKDKGEFKLYQANGLSVRNISLYIHSIERAFYVEFVMNYVKNTDEIQLVMKFQRAWGKAKERDDNFNQLKLWFKENEKGLGIREYEIGEYSIKCDPKVLAADMDWADKINEFESYVLNHDKEILISIKS